MSVKNCLPGFENMNPSRPGQTRANRSSETGARVHPCKGELRRHGSVRNLNSGKMDGEKMK